MDISQSHARAGDDLTIHSKFKVTRFLQRRMLWSDRDDKLVPNTAWLRSLRRLNGCRLFRLEALPHRINIRGPVIRKKEAGRIWRPNNCDAEHLAQFAFEK